MASKVNAIIKNATGKHSATVIFLHGLGDSVTGWSEMADAMNMGWTKFIFPKAANKAVSIHGGAKMPAWFDITSLEPGGKHDQEGFDESHKFVVSLIENEIANGIPSNRIILGGVSQGGAQAVYTTLHYEKPLAGYLCLSSWLAFGESYPDAMHSANAKTPLFMAHGKQDPLVRYEFGTMSRDKLVEIGVPVEWHEYNMGHSSCPQEIMDLKAFLLAKLPKDGGAGAAAGGGSSVPLPIPDDLSSLSVKELKAILQSRHIGAADCLEKTDLIRRLEENRS